MFSGRKGTLTVAFLSVALVVAAFVALAFQVQVQMIRNGARVEAERIARTIASIDIPDAIHHAGVLQRKVDLLTGLHQRDLVIVDRDKMSVAASDHYEVLSPREPGSSCRSATRCSRRHALSWSPGRRDTIKVDRAFIRNLPGDNEDMAITEAIIATGKTLTLTVVAEGVETREQAEFVRALVRPVSGLLLQQARARRAVRRGVRRHRGPARTRARLTRHPFGRWSFARARTTLAACRRESPP